MLQRPGVSRVWQGEATLTVMASNLTNGQTRVRTQRHMSSYPSLANEAVALILGAGRQPFDEGRRGVEPGRQRTYYSSIALFQKGNR